MKEFSAKRLLGGFRFLESPRWHDDRYYFSDFYDHAVYAFDGQSTIKIVELDEQPSGLGWLPDDTLLIVGMNSLCLWSYKEGVLSKYADLSSVLEFLANDMVTDSKGRCYVGNFGFDLDDFIETKGEEALVTPPFAPKTNVALVDESGIVSVAASEISFPNGTVIAPDEKTLILAETLAFKLSAFDINKDGSLSGKRVFADLSAFLCAPDGICMDSRNEIWVANAAGKECLRIREGGEITGRVELDNPCFACMLGGESGKELMIFSAPTSNKKKVEKSRDCAIYIAEVDCGHAGRP